MTVSSSRPSRAFTTAAAPTFCRSRSQNGSGAARLDEADRPLERPDLDDVADRDREVLAAVDRDERLVRVDDRQRTTWLGLDHDRADRRQVGGDRRDDEVPADRVDDRAAGRERVAGRAGRAGDDEAVGDERGEVRVVDLDVEPADAGQRAAGDHDVVEGEVAVTGRWRASAPCGRAAAQDPALERHPLVDPVVAVDDRAEDRLEVAGLGLRQEADLAEVDAEERHVDLGDRPGRPQERAVAAEHDQQRPSSAARATSAVRLARRRLPVADAAHPAPAGGPRAAARPPPRSSGCRRSRSAAIVIRRRRGPGRPRRSARRSPRSPGPGARWTRNSRLPSGPSERRGDDGARAEADAARRRPTIRSRTSRWIAGSRTTPWSVRPRPASNCGLTRATIWPRGAERRGDRAEHEAERDERDVDHGERDRLRQASPRSASGRSSAPSRRPAGRGAAIRRAGRDRRRGRRRGSRRAAAGRP